MLFQKTLRGYYFRSNSNFRWWRNHIGPQEFDNMYRQVFQFLSRLLPGQYFIVKNLCKKNPDNHPLFLMMIDLYYNMDLFVNLSYDPETDRVTILQPNLPHWMKPPYHPRDVYSEIIKNPKQWGIDPNDLI